MPEAMAEDFKKIDGAGNTNGTIDKKELWDFINSGKVAKMNESDFNALFSQVLLSFFDEHFATKNSSHIFFNHRNCDIRLVSVLIARHSLYSSS